MKAIVVAAALGVALAPQRPTFRATVDTVEVYVTVSHRDGRLVPGLPQQEFEILSDGKPVELTVFSNEIKTITVALLLDTSGSMATRVLWFRESARHFAAALKGDDRARIGSFGEEVAISPHLTGDKAVLERVLRDEIWPGPGAGTPLWAALSEGIRSISMESGRRAVLILSDGIDTMSRMLGPEYSPGAVRSRAIEHSVLIYAVGAAGRGLGALKATAEDSGGGYIEVEPDANLQANMSRVADELRHQYMIGFTPPVLDGRTRELEVRLKTKELRARAPRAYVARKRTP